MYLVNSYLPIINEILQVIALIIGSSWALYQFIKFRKLSPKLDTSNEVEVIRREGDSAYMRIKVNVKNIGEVVVKDFIGNVSICDFSKISDEEIKKFNNNDLPSNICLFDFSLSDFDYTPELIEPGEKDFFNKIIRIDLLPNVIEIHSHIENINFRPRGRIFNKDKVTRIGWTNSSIHKINGKDYG